jgi:probable FeS assembly SUF system protein SufT
MEQNLITLIRDCDALLIPSATPISIPSGTRVRITQMLGGAITIEVDGNLARINSEDADALGIELEVNKSVGSKREIKPATGPVDLDKVWEQLKTCYDPEIPVNIVDLGLIYSCKVVSNENNTSNQVEIEMTLTAPACAMGPILAQDAEDKVFTVENVTAVNINIVFDPIWTQDNMTDAAKLELGLL